jgi:hypothetical protein
MHRRLLSGVRHEDYLSQSLRVLIYIACALAFEHPDGDVVAREGQYCVGVHCPYLFVWGVRSFPRFGSAPSPRKGVNLDGERDVLGLWLGPTGGEGAKQWMSMLTELKNRGVADALIVCCDGLKGCRTRSV